VGRAQARRRDPAVRRVGDGHQAGVMAGLLDWLSEYGAGVKERVGLLGRDPVEYTRQALLDVLPSDAEAKAAQGMLMGGPVDQQAYQDYLAKIQNMGNFLGSLKVGKIKPPPYQIEHRPMTVEGGAAPLHDAAKSFGEDVYGPNALQYFGSGDRREASVLKLLRSVRGNPNAEVTIYRGVPENAPRAINPGDWVTLDPRVAADYGRVVEMKVPASEVTTWADSLLEFGYFPSKK